MEIIGAFCLLLLPALICLSAISDFILWAVGPLDRKREREELAAAWEKWNETHKSASDE